MTIIQLSIGRSSYKITCQEEEREKLLQLAARLNSRVNELAISLKNADEKTLLVITALTIENELNNKEKEEIDNDIDNEQAKINDEDIQDAVSENIENIAEYVEKLTNKIRNY